MLRFTGSLVAAAMLLAASPARAAAPIAPVVPVVETLYGQRVVDNYRYMETLDDTTVSWMKAQGAETRRLLDAIAPRAALEARIADFTGGFGFVADYAKFGDRAFYLRRAPGSDNYDLVVADERGTRTLVDMAAYRAAHDGTPHAINYFLASPDGSKAAVGISEGGSEHASLLVFDARTGQHIAGPIDRADNGATAWSDDARIVYFNRLKELAPGESEINRYRDSTLLAWNLVDEPQPILGSTVGRGPPFGADETPFLAIVPGAPMAVAINENGVQNELVLWLAPVVDLADPTTQWTPLASREDGVTSFDMRGEEIFLLSHAGAPTFKVLTLKAGEPLTRATTLVPADPNRVIASIHAAADALYVNTRSGAYSQLLRIATGTTEAREVELPFKGHISEAFSDPRTPGIVLALESFVVPPTELVYDPASGRFRDLTIGVTPKRYDSSRYQVLDIEAKARDGVTVPLSVVRARNATGASILLLEGYGSYGISLLAEFSPGAIALVDAGGSTAVCHVRGGGELGEAWRLGGKDANKPNTWRDLIACAEALIERGLTTEDRLFIAGGSAGGITVGRAMTERPDLFAGVIASVPFASTLRGEFEPTGPANIPEFGTIANEEGFRNLYTMDTIQHVVPGTAYPAVLVTTGLNDPRVAPWQPAKLTAALQASGTKQPVLMRVQKDEGHGVGSTKTQRDRLRADIYTFMFWRTGLEEWQPRVP